MACFAKPYYSSFHYSWTVTPNIATNTSYTYGRYNRRASVALLAHEPLHRLQQQLEALVPRHVAEDGEPRHEVRRRQATPQRAPAAVAHPVQVPRGNLRVDLSLWVHHYCAVV